MSVVYRSMEQSLEGFSESYAKENGLPFCERKKRVVNFLLHPPRTKGCRENGCETCFGPGFCYEGYCVSCPFNWVCYMCFLEGEIHSLFRGEELKRGFGSRFAEPCITFFHNYFDYANLTDDCFLAEKKPRRRQSTLQ